MSLWVEVAEAAAMVNVAILVGLAAIWGRNYRRLRSKHALGLLVFAALLLAENLLWVYGYRFDPAFRGWVYDGSSSVQRAMMGLCVLETVGLLFLSWVTWD